MTPTLRRASRPAAGSLVAAAAFLAGPLAAPAVAAPVDIQLLTINDFHGRISQDGFAGVPGAAVLATAVQTLSADVPTALVAAGDNVGATPFVSAVQDDAPTIDLLNRIGLAASAVGNHELDRGYAWLSGSGTHGVDGEGLASWPTLGANVGGESPELAASTVIDVGGVQVGLVGVVTEQTPSLVAADGIAGLTFDGVVEAANAAAAELAQTADVVVLLAHEGPGAVATDAATCDALLTGTGAFSRLVQGASADVDAVVGGHTHLSVDCDQPLEGGGTRPVLEAESYGRALGRLTMTVDPDTGEVSAAAGEVLPLAPDSYPADPEIAALVEGYEAEADVVGAVPVGEILGDLARSSGTDGDDRGRESVAGNFIADVQLDATADPDLGGAQIAFMNPGGIRADFTFAESDGEGDGVVTYGEAATVQPFANTLVTMTLTGAQVEQVLEEQWQPDGEERAFLHLGVSRGFSYVADPAAPAGERVLRMTLDGEEVDPAGEYRVTVNSFLAGGGDNFATLTEGTDRQDNGFSDLDMLVDHFETSSPVDPADHAVGRADLGGVVPGEPGGDGGGDGGTGAPGPGGQNPGLVVDTGVDTGGDVTAAPSGTSGWAAGALGGVLVLAGVGAGTAARWRRVRAGR